MISPWHVGEEPHEDAEGVVHFFMASLFDICPHVSLGETTANTVRWPIGSIPQENASSKIAEWYREYGVVHVQQLGEVWRNALYHWNPIDPPVRGSRYLTTVAPLLDDLILWPEEVLQPMQADTPHNRRSLFRVETLVQALVIRRAVRNYDPRNVRITFDGQELRGVSGDFTIVDDPEDPAVVDRVSREYAEYPQPGPDRVDALARVWRELRPLFPPPRSPPPPRRRHRPRNR